LTIPLLAIPVINRPDLLTRCLASIDTVPDRVLVIDNSPDGLDFTVPAQLEPVLYIEAPASNLGVAGSWNHAIKTHPQAPWWGIANADTEFAPGDLDALASEMERGGPRWVGVNGDWRVFGLSFEAVQMAGLFDENHHPIYLEDCDYERRCDLVGVPRYFIDGGSTHVGSAAYRSDERYARANARTYPENVAYYRAKWGGGPRGGERFATPFDSGSSVAAWSLDINRLRDLAWDRDGKP
jgi:GT2 family glycosyltransferase